MDDSGNPKFMVKREILNYLKRNPEVIDDEMLSISIMIQSKYLDEVLYYSYNTKTNTFTLEEGDGAGRMYEPHKNSY